MTGDSVQLTHEHANPDGPLGYLDTQQLFNGDRVAQLIVDRAEVVHTRDVGAALHVAELFALLFHARVEIANNGLSPENKFSVEFQHQT